MKCNLQCPMCLPYLAGSTVNGQHMDPEDFEKIARAVFPFVDSFQLTISGEPLMSKGLDRMLALAEEYGVRTEYYTNGTLLNDRMISMIMPTLGQICISFDGATKDTFEFLRKGATFEHVLRNLERLAAEIAKVPTAHRPTIGLAVTVMERNVRELPGLVELAHRLDLDFVSIAHVLPVVPEMQPESLVHHVDLAKEWIGRALDRARELGVPGLVAPLDQIIAAMAVTDRPSGASDRPVAIQRRVRRGTRGARGEREPAARQAAAARHDCRGAPPRRRAAREAEQARRAPEPPDHGPPSGLPDSIWYCEFLWNRIYVNADGSVRPCCTPGVPDIGNFREGTIESIWDGDAYRAMRVGLVRKEPAPVCRGCQGIREVTDPAEIARLLQGRAMPEPMPLPPVLLPVIDADAVAVQSTPEAPAISAIAPVVEWSAVPGALGYAFEASSEERRNALRFDSAVRGAELSEPRFGIPAWIWNEAPAGSRIDWRAIARMPHARLVVARGSLVRVEPSALPLSGQDGVRPGPVVRSGRPSRAPLAIRAGRRRVRVRGLPGRLRERPLHDPRRSAFSPIPRSRCPSALWKRAAAGIGLRLARPRGLTRRAGTSLQQGAFMRDPRHRRRQPQ